MLILLALAKNKKPKLRGRVAEYCPGCADISPMRVLDDPHGGVKGTCETCGVQVFVDPRDYTRFDRSRPGLPLDELIIHTHPHAHEDAEHALTLDDRLVSRQLTPMDRQRVVARAYTRADALVRGAGRGNIINVLVASYLIGGISACIALMVWAETLRHPWSAIGLYAGLAGIVAVIAHTVLTVRRLDRTPALRQIAPELSGLGCTPADLRAGYKRSRRMRLESAARVGPRALGRAIARNEARQSRAA